MANNYGTHIWLIGESDICNDTLDIIISAQEHAEVLKTQHSCGIFGHLYTRGFPNFKLFSKEETNPVNFHDVIMVIYFNDHMGHCGIDIADKQQWYSINDDDMDLLGLMEDGRFVDIDKMLIYINNVLLEKFLCAESISWPDIEEEE